MEKPLKIDLTRGDFVRRSVANKMIYLKIVAIPELGKLLKCVETLNAKVDSTMDVDEGGNPALFVLLFVAMALGGVGYYIWQEWEKKQEAMKNLPPKKKYGKKKMRRIQLKERSKYAM
eukprot:jgi/Bigna1/131067/aug1.13_g5775